VKAVSLLIQGLDKDVVSSLSLWLGNTCAGAQVSQIEAPPIPSRIGLASQSAIELIDPRTVVCVEGNRNYSLFHVVDKKPYTVSYSLGRFEAQLTQPYFMRVHKRFIVNLLEVKRYEKKEGGTLQMSNGMQIPVSPSKRKAFLGWVLAGGEFGMNGNTKNENANE
jgi:two-component system, LytTR family, response regulator